MNPRTAATTAPPALRAPADGASVDPRRLVFQWEDDAEASAYWLQLSPNPDFEEVLMETFIGSGSALTVYDLLPADGACYYWRMRAQHGTTWGTYGPAATFCTATSAARADAAGQPRPAPEEPSIEPAERPAERPPERPAKRPAAAPQGAPIPQAPVGGVPADASATTFEWTPVADATGYQLQVAPSDAFDHVLVDLPLTATDALTVYGLLPPGTTCFWRIRARVGDEERPWSRAATFRAASDDEVETHAQEEAAAYRAERRAAERAAEQAPSAETGTWESSRTTSGFAVGWFALLLITFLLTVVWIALVVPGA